jgi:hypothetical protein
MRKKIFCLFFVAALFILTSRSFAGIWGESVSISDLSDGRSFYNAQYDPPYSEGGLHGYWPSVFTIQWDISQDPESLIWTYEYTLFSARKDISHFILELTEGDSFADSSWGDGAAEWGVWDGSHGQSDPGWPEGAYFYGMKFDYGGRYVTYTLETTRDPVWGNFYVKSGKHHGDNVYAYNSGLEEFTIDSEGMIHFTSDNKLDFIVRPDGGAPPVVPEPASSLLFLTGSAIFAYRRYFKKA